MTGRILAFPKRSRSEAPTPPGRLPAPPGADVYLCHEEQGWFSVHDESRSGSSAGHHGYFATYAEAAAEGRRIATLIGGTFHDLTEPGGSAA